MPMLLALLSFPRNPRQSPWLLSRIPVTWEEKTPPTPTGELGRAAGCQRLTCNNRSLDEQVVLGLVTG